MLAKSKKLLNTLIYIVFFIYLLFLVRIVIFKTGIGAVDFREIQFIPFLFVKDFFDPAGKLDVVLKNVVGNIAIFIPFGLVLPYIFGKLNFKKTVLTGLITSLCIETVQYIFRIGMCDIDDVILNTLGVTIGALLYFRFFMKRQLGIFIFLIVFGIIGGLSLFLYAPSMLPSNIQYVNREVLGDLDEDSYTVSGKCKAIENGKIILENGEEYQLAEDCKIIVKKQEFQYSPNGNIQKQIITYSEISPDEAAEIIEAGKNKMQEKLWIEEGECWGIEMTV